ncbi:hypothetical protein KBX37_15565 [Micromonospora sp. U56]|uniref:TrlF family AAA-like ATPase n=1 Tax=Micromonospora sp. U56 TaxID=2824900 RepID=UPI001B378EB5|nr:hypothetical protein [Micromonospora sp. U56]MBQ0894502.1 hypothetical protein [Micromonospora sp. U56]
MYNRGAEWRKWDLHVHTPDSIRHNYSGADPWDRFLTELTQLPPEVTVLGINDYWFLDGYRRVRAEFESGRLPNIDEVFPVVEVRTENFGGVDGKLRRINLHFICDPALSADVIERQLIASLKPTYRLKSDDPYETWSQVVTRESLSDLGGSIKSQAPPAELHKYGSDLIEGFNNVCVSFHDSVRSVRENSALSDHVLIAVGKTEWAALKWNDQSIATKKTLLNSADVVFTAAGSREEFAKSCNALREAKVNSRLLDCSDAHTWKDAEEKDRLGNTLTWINADPVFKGLQHAIQEYDHRVTVDPRPVILERRATRPTTVIDKVVIRPNPATNADHRLFNCDVALNPGFVVILGNKGQGKSALLDIIAAAANSDRYEDYSFLTPARFRRKSGEAQHYESEITWADGHTATVRLSEPFTSKEPVRVDYLPQSLIERVCLADPYSKQERQFEAEIERVVFGHISPGDRGNATSLKQFLLERSGEAYHDLGGARAKIAEAARQLMHYEDRRAELEGLDLDARLQMLRLQVAEIEQELTVREGELVALRTAAGAEDLQAELDGLKETRETLVEQKRLKLQDIREHESSIEDVFRLESKFLEHLETALATAQELSRRMGLGETALFSVDFRDEEIEDWRARESKAVHDARNAVTDPSNGVDVRIEGVESKIREISHELQQRAQGSEDLSRSVDDLAQRREHLLGDVANPNSLRGVEALADELRGIPAEDKRARDALKAAFFEAHNAAMSIFAIQRAAYADATNFVSTHDLANQVGLEFAVELRVKGFTSSWSDIVNKQRLSDLHEVFESPGKESILEGVNLASADELFLALLHLQDRIGREKGQKAGAVRRLSSVVRSSYSVSDLLAALYDLKWLEGEYVIRSFRAELSELSPGQRGLVLLMFYLLIDKSDRPLLLDQPEENLDNQTVRELLIPALRAAVERRQVVVVTHNPNLAVVGDADQLVVAALNSGAFSYESGSLAQRSIGTQSIDVLEGTRAAFDNREEKYDRVVGRT